MSPSLCPHGTPWCVPLVNNGLNKREEEGERNERRRKEIEERKERKKAHPCSDSSYLPTLSSSRSSLNLPHPHSYPPSLSSVHCNSHCSVAAPVLWMKSCAVTPLGVNSRECSVVSLLIPACRLSSWYSLQLKSRCLTFWTLIGVLSGLGQIPK